MDEGTREEKEAGDQRGQGEASEQPKRWGTHVTIDLTDFTVNGFDYGLTDVGSAIRESFVQGFKNLADKTRIKDEKGQYLYFLPAEITVTTDTSKKFFIRFVFTCSMGGRSSGDLRDAREN